MSGKQLISLSGRSAGTVTVGARVRVGKRVYYDCECSCGTHMRMRIDVVQKRLLDEKWSCGCIDEAAIVDLPGEVWRTVAGFEGVYEVSSAGRVKSLSRNAKSGRFKGRILRPAPTPSGYLAVVIDGKTTAVHKLVLETFRGPRPPGADGCHNDGSRTNNQVENLRWDTRAGNMADTAIHGTRLEGERHPFARLSKSDVLAILALRGKRSMQSIADEYGVAPGTIQCIYDGRTWKHIERRAA